ncbi:MAG TPA: FkbM family methyltransferase [Streptosporangiaceae bacterium]
MSAPKLVELDDGLHVFTSSTIDARFLYDEIFREGCYDDIGLPARSLVIDVGANIGMFALFVKLRYPDAEVLAFEPAPESAAVLRQNISLHHLDGVLVNEIALGAVRERAAPFTYYPAIPANSTRYPQEKELQKRVMARTYTAKAVERLHTGRLITVAVDRLSRFLPTDRPVDLLKVDVEGGELDVLLGIDPPHWPLIRQVILEVHDFNGRLAAICDLLSSHGLESSVGPAPLIDPEILSYVVHAVRRPAPVTPRA